MVDVTRWIQDFAKAGASRDGPTYGFGIPAIDQRLAAVGPGRVVVIRGDRAPTVQLAVQLASDAAGNGRRALVVAPFEDGDDLLSRALLMPYALRRESVMAPRSARADEVMGDLVAVRDQLSIHVLGAADAWSAAGAELLATGHPDILLLLDADAAGAEIGAMLDRDEVRGGATKPAFALLRLARARGMTVVVTTGMARADSGCDLEQVADVLLTAERAHPVDPAHWDARLGWEVRPTGARGLTHLARDRSGRLDEALPGAASSTGSPGASPRSGIWAERDMERRLRAWRREHARPLHEIGQARDGATVAGEGMVSRLELKTNGQGRAWAIVELVDARGGVALCTLFPKVWSAGPAEAVVEGSRLQILGRALRPTGPPPQAHVLEWRLVDVDEPKES